MKKLISEKCYEGKKVYGKGKIFRHCYFENCNIKYDRHTIFYGCFVSKNGRSVLL